MNFAGDLKTNIVAQCFAAFKKGGQLTVLYPIYATTFIWAALLGLWGFGTPIKGENICGMTLLIGGMYLMGR